MRFVKALLAAAIAASLVIPATAIAKPADKRSPRIVVYPKYSTKPRTGPYGFLPGYRQPPALSDWRDRSSRYGDPRQRWERRYWSDGEWRYGWGYPQYYHGRWNGGSFGPCWTYTPIGQIWNCGM